MDSADPTVPFKSKKGGNLTYDLYRIFQQYLRNGCNKIPDTNLLLDLVDGPVTTTEKRKRLRKKFKSWAARMDARPSDGRLIYKTTGKLIIPEEYFFTIVKKKHCGNGAKHLNLTQTFEAVMREYSVGKREFGIDRDLIVAIVNNCPDPECRRASFWRQLPKNQPRYAGQQAGDNLFKSQQKFVYHIPDQTLDFPEYPISEQSSYGQNFNGEPEVKKVKLDFLNGFAEENAETKMGSDASDSKRGSHTFHQYNVQQYPRCIYTTASNTHSLNYTSARMRAFPSQNVVGSDDDDIQPLNLVMKDKSKANKKPSAAASCTSSADDSSDVQIIEIDDTDSKKANKKPTDSVGPKVGKSCASGSGYKEERKSYDNKPTVEQQRPPSPRYHYFTRSSSGNAKKVMTAPSYTPVSSNSKSPNSMKKIAKLAISEFSKITLPFKQQSSNMQNAGKKSGITHYPVILPKLKPEHLQFYSDPSHPGQIFFKASREFAEKSRQHLCGKQFGSGDSSAFRKPERMKQGPSVPSTADGKIGLANLVTGPPIPIKLMEVTDANEQSLKIDEALDLDENSLNDLKGSCSYAKKGSPKNPLHKSFAAVAKSKSFQSLSAKEQFFLAQKSNITALKHRLALEKSIAKKLQRSKKFRQMLQRKQVNARIDELYLLLLKRIHMLGRRLKPSVASITARSQECLKNYINDCISLIYNIRKEVPEIQDDHWLTDVRKKFPSFPTKPSTSEPALSKPE